MKRREALRLLLEEAQRVVDSFDRTCSNGAMHDAVYGRPIDFGRGGYDGGLRRALAEYRKASR